MRNDFSKTPSAKTVVAIQIQAGEVFHNTLPNQMRCALRYK